MVEHPDDTDLLFKALADPSRRKLLDLLHAHDGRTLNELCEHLDMTRQGVTQHLDLLEAANLVATVRRGREKLHFLNPVPLQKIYERWISKFERPRLKALANLKRSGSTYLLTTTFVARGSNDDIRVGRWRPLNLERAPFNLPAPLRSIDEECPEPANRDKRLALWRIDSIPD